MLATQRGAGSPAVGWLAPFAGAAPLAAANLLASGVTSFHSWPPSRVIHRLPSSLPTQSTSALRGDSASALALPRLVRVISGEITFSSSPCFSERKTKLPAQ